MSSQIKHELPLVNSHNFDPTKCTLRELPWKNIFALKYSYDDIRTDLPLNIYLEYVQIIKLGKFNTIMVNLENSKNFLNVHSALCSHYKINSSNKFIFIKFSDTNSRLTLIPAKSSQDVPIQVSSYAQLETTFKNFYQSYNLRGKLILTPILNLNTSNISYNIIDGEISYPMTRVEDSIKNDIHKVRLDSNIHIML